MTLDASNDLVAFIYTIHFKYFPVLLSGQTVIIIVLYNIIICFTETIHVISHYLSEHVYPVRTINYNKLLPQSNK